MEMVPGSNETINNYAIQSPNPMPSNIQNQIVSSVKLNEIVQPPQGIILEQITISPDEKEKLMQNLKEIRTTSYAVEFCSLLIKAQKMHEENKVRKAWLNDPEYESVYKELQEIVCHEPVEIVKIICREISAPKEESERLLNILPKSKRKEGHVEYLNQLIETVESLIKSLAPPDLYIFALASKVEDHEKPIVALKECLIADGKYKTESAFGGMFFFGLKRFDVSQEEKKRIVNMMVEAMPNIMTFIKGYCLDFNYTIGIARLQIRSTLQFISDMLAEFSAEHKTVRELIGSLDEVIKTVDEVSEYLLTDIIDTSSMVEVDCCVEFLDQTLEEYYAAGACCVPKEHTWWQRYKRNFF